MPQNEGVQLEYAYSTPTVHLRLPMLRPVLGHTYRMGKPRAAACSLHVETQRG